MYGISKDLHQDKIMADSSKSGSSSPFCGSGDGCWASAGLEDLFLFLSLYSFWFDSSMMILLASSCSFSDISVIFFVNIDK